VPSLGGIWLTLGLLLNRMIKSREVSKLKMQSVAKAKRRLSITQGCFYSAFLAVLGVLSYGNRDSAR